MRKYATEILFVFIIVLFSNCASSYNYIKPETNSFSNILEVNGVTFAYNYKVLSNAGNKKYYKKSYFENIQIIEVKIVNNTRNSIDFSKDISFYKGDNFVYQLNSTILKKELKQKSASFLLYSFIPLLAFLNFREAEKANKVFFENLDKYNLSNKIIKPGETVFGIIGLASRSFNYEQIRIELNKQ